MSSGHRPDPQDSSTVRLMCSFGGRILPRPHDHQLRYVGGETRIISLPRSSSFSSLLSRLSTLLPPPPPTLKYQLPNEDLDSLISLTSDDDLDNMLHEYDRLALSSSSIRTPRLRLFLFPASTAFGSIVDTSPSGRHDQWFLDALNGSGGGLERGRSEASSVISEVPDYLFGLDTNSDKPVNQTTSEPGSPFTASSIQQERSKPDEEVNRVGQPAGFVGNPVWSYVAEPVPVYYVPAVQGGGLPVQYVQAVGPVGAGQVRQHFSGVVGNPVQGGPVYMSSGQLGGSGAYDVTTLLYSNGSSGIPLGVGKVETHQPNTGRISERVGDSSS